MKAYLYVVVGLVSFAFGMAFTVALYRIDAAVESRKQKGAHRG